MSACNKCKRIFEKVKSLFTDRMKHRNNMLRFRDYWQFCKCLLHHRRSSINVKYFHFLPIKQNDLTANTLPILSSIHQVYLCRLSVSTVWCTKLRSWFPQSSSERDPLEKCDPELTSVLSKLNNRCLVACCFPNCWKYSSWWSNG